MSHIICTQPAQLQGKIMKKLKYTNIIFDADGTLIDTVPEILMGFNYAMEKCGRPLLTVDDIKPFIGPSIIDSLQNALGFDPEGAMVALNHYRDFYSSKGYAMAGFFDGIVELLDNLIAAGCTLCIATNKPQIYIDKIIEKLGATAKFKCIAGPEYGDPSTDKTPLIKRAMAAAGDTNGSRSIMVGDRYIDIEGAASAGIASIAVEWGTAATGEFQKYVPTYIAQKPSDILSIIKNS